MTIEAYKVAITLVLESNVAREMGNVARQFENLERIIKGTQQNVNELAAGLRGLSRIGASAAENWTRAAQAMERAARAARSAGQSMPPGGGFTPSTPGTSVPPAGPRAATAPANAVNPVAQYYLAQRAAGVGGTGGPPAIGGGGLVPYNGGMPPLNLGPQPPGGGAGGGGRGGGPGNGGTLSGLGPLAEQLATFFAVRESMKEDVALRSALMSMGFRPENPDFNASLQRLRGLASSGARGTIFSEAQAAGGMPAAAGVLGFGGSDPASRAAAVAKFEAIYPTILRLGEVAEMQHMGGMGESMVAAISYAHMTDRYDPKDLEPGLDRLLNVARLTHESVAGEQAVLKYSVPIGQAAGMKADDIAGLTGFLQVLGFSGTTAGTGLGQLISGLAPISITKHGADAKAKALQALGVMDDKGGIKEDVAPGGHVNAMALLQHIADFAKKNEPIEVLKVLREAFTVRGMRVAGAMESPDAIPRLLTYIDQLNRLPGARATQEALAQSPLQAFEQMIARANDVGNTLVTGTLPGLQKAFEGLTTVLTGVNTFLKDHEGTASIGGYLAEALGLGFLFKSGRGLLGMLGGGAAGAGAAGAGAAGGAAGVLGASLGLGLLFAITKAAKDGLDAGSDALMDKIFGPGYAKRTHDDLAKGAPNLIGSANAGEIPTVKVEPSATQSMAMQIGAAVKAALVGVGVNLDGKKVGEIVAGRLADQMSRPASGTPSADLRLSPWMPGVLGTGTH